jgi:hypothetical protein
MSKLPLFYKDGNGNWKVFPIHLFQKNSKGDWQLNSYTGFTEKDLMKLVGIGHLLIYSPNRDVAILKLPKPEEDE